MTDYNHTLTNPGAESGDITGWTSIIGSNLTVRSANPTPNTGSYYFYSSNDSEFRYYQRVDLVSDSVPTATIDSGGIWFWVEWYQSSYSNDDEGEIQIRSLNSSQVEINTQSYGLFAAPDQEWNQYIFAPILPANTRYVDIIIHGYRTSGTACDAYFDDITAKSTDVNTTDARLTQHLVEVLRSGDASDARLTQHVVEVLRSGDASDARLTQHVVEVLRSTEHITFNNFENETVGAAPVTVNGTWNPGELEVIAEDGVSGQQLVQENDLNYLQWSFYSVNDPTNVDDVHVLCKIKLSKKVDKTLYSSNYSYIAAVILRATATYSSRDAIAVLIGKDKDDDEWALQVGYWDNAVWTELATYELDLNNIDLNEDEWFYVRFYVVGTSIKAKAWHKAETEPTDWQIEQTDSTISTPGLIGWGWRTLNNVSNIYHQIDFLNIITDDITDPVVPGDEGTSQVIVAKSNIDLIAEDVSTNYPIVYKSSVNVLTKVDKEYAKIDSNVIVL